MTNTIQNIPDWKAAKAANAYIRRIKNPLKQSYARAYYVWVVQGCPNAAPDHACSVMAAQAVRDNLRAFGIVAKEKA